MLISGGSAWPPTFYLMSFLTGAGSQGLLMSHKDPLITTVTLKFCPWPTSAASGCLIIWQSLSYAAC